MTEHTETMKRLDLELAKQDLEACEATVTHAQEVEKIVSDQEQEWYLILDKFESTNWMMCDLDNPQEASSFHVMPNLYLRVLVLWRCLKESVNTMGLLCMWPAQGMCVNWN